MRSGYDPRADIAGRRRRSTSVLPPLPVGRILAWAGGALTILAAAGAVIYTSVNSKKAAQPAPAPAAVVNTPPPEQAKLVKMTHTFLAAKRASELAGIVRMADQSPESILSRLDELNAVDGPTKSVEYLGALQNLTQPIEAVVVFFQNGHNRIALFCPDLQGEWLMDFDAYARGVSLPWKEMLSGGDAEAVARVYVSNDAYYNGRFSDEKSWACSGIYSPDHEGLMFAYAARKSPADQAIRDALNFKLKTSAGMSGRAGLNARMLRMTLQLRHHAGDENRQFEVIKVIADDWATPAQTLEEHYH